MKIYPLFMLMLFLLIIPSLSQNITREDALRAIEKAKTNIDEMYESGFSTSSVNDTLTAASHALERADFAQVLRQNATGELAQKAKKVLEGLDYQGFSFQDVLKYTAQIEQRKQKSYELSDSLRALELKIQDYKLQSLDTRESEQMLEVAKDAFNKERYQEAQVALSKADSSLEEKKAQATTLKAVISSSKSFFQKNWKEILIFFILLSILGWFSYKRMKIKLLKEKISKLKAEETSLTKLIKQTQIDRFQKGRISESIYKLKVEKYTKRLNEVRQDLPVLQAQLKKEKTKHSNKPA